MTAWLSNVIVFSDSQPMEASLASPSKTVKAYTLVAVGLVIVIAAFLLIWHVTRLRTLESRVVHLTSLQKQEEAIGKRYDKTKNALAGAMDEGGKFSSKRHDGFIDGTEDNEMALTFSSGELKNIEKAQSLTSDLHDIEGETLAIFASQYGDSPDVQRYRSDEAKKHELRAEQLDSWSRGVTDIVDNYKSAVNGTWTQPADEHEIEALFAEADKYGDQVDTYADADDHDYDILDKHLNADLKSAKRDLERAKRFPF